MNESAISQYLTGTFEGVDVVIASGDSFFFYNPDRNIPPDHRFPFVTLVTSDINDPFSHLNRPSVFRLNIGIGKQTFHSLFGDPAALPSVSAADSGEISGDYDFAALNQLMPHPVYGRMLWVCILNPSDEMFETNVRPLLTEAYEMAVNRHKRRAARN
ncbi:hypothetical protein KDA_52130 [Dictyobacter alpinus]|uniref:DUF6194 domain-containing protein n=1 Tax=Dictyobacter alpinus TaxID=2014873 RepID=A0A402BEH8_9CHLR|nr:DUF6194 family protein [Dictyobacter alpinus]GCE29729.1 hypothetical protein KDA_52130 [Dictyobacter alpinus]